MLLNNFFGKFKKSKTPLFCHADQTLEQNVTSDVGCAVKNASSKESLLNSAVKYSRFADQKLKYFSASFDKNLGQKVFRSATKI